MCISLIVPSYLPIMLSSAGAKICRHLWSLVPLISRLASVMAFCKERHDEASPCPMPFSDSMDSVKPLKV
jgi:hypothetical protein